MFRMRNLLYLVMFFGCLLSVTAVDLNDGLYSYYNFEDTSYTKVVDVFGTKNITNKCGGATVTSGVGIHNNAYNFSNGGYWASWKWFTGGNLNNGSNFTLSFWVYDNADANYAILGNYETSGWDVYQVGSTNDLYIEGSAVNLNLDPTPFVQDKWVSMVITKNDGTYKIYVNGVLNSTVISFDAVDWGSNRNFSIGTNNAPTCDADMNGMIDEVGYWTRTLSDAEVLELNNTFYPFNSLSVNWDGFSPTNRSINYQTSLSYYYNVSQVGLSSVNCSFYINNSLNSTTNNVVAGTTYNFTIIKPSGYVANLSSYVNCTGTGGLLANSGVKWVLWNISGTTSVVSNLSSLNRVKSGFDVLITYFNLSNIESCGVYDNSSFFNCASDIMIGAPSSGSKVISCSIPIYGDLLEENVLFTPYCSNSSNSYNASSKEVFIDNIDPVINVVGPNSGFVYFNNTGVNITVVVNDSNVFAFEINCSVNNIPSFNFSVSDINSSTYSFSQNVFLRTAGNHVCVVNTSDDHTSNIFDEKSDIKESWLFDKYSGSVGDLKLTIPEVDGVEIIRSTDRVSLKLTPRNGVAVVKVKCPYILYKRVFSDYREHWVCADGVTGYWIDGETEGNDEVSSIQDRDEVIYTYATSNDYVVMKSIGGLNYGSSFFNVTVVAAGRLNFTGHNVWNSSLVYSFNISATNSSGSVFTNSTTNGWASFNLPAGTYSVSQSSTNYPFSNLVSSYVVAGDTVVNTSFWQSEVTVNVREAASRDLIANSYIQFNNSGVSNTSMDADGTILFRPNSGVFSVYANNSPTYFNNSFQSTSGTLVSGEQRIIDLNLTRVYNIVLRREQDGSLFNMTDNSTQNVSVVINVACDDGDYVTFTILTNQQQSPSLSCNWNGASGELGWRIDVNYLSTTGASYYRYVNPSFSDSDIDIYLMDLHTGFDEVVQYTIPLQDLTNEYGKAIISAFTSVDGLKTEVTQMRIDVSSTAKLWLDKGQSYNLYVTSDNGEETNLGYHVADAASEASVVLPPIRLDSTPNVHSQVGVNYLANQDAGNITLRYIDTSTYGFYNLTWQIYELHPNGENNVSYSIISGRYNSTLVYNVSVFNNRSINLSVINLDKYKSYSSIVIVDHYEGLTEFSPEQMIWFGYNDNGFEGFGSFSDDIKLWIACLAILLASMSLTFVTVEIGFTFILILAWVFHKAFSPSWFVLISTPDVLAGISSFTYFLMFFSALTVWVWIRKMQRVV